MCRFPHLTAANADRRGCRCERCRKYNREKRNRLFENPEYRARQNKNRRIALKRPENVVKVRARKAERRAKYSTGVKFLTMEEKEKINIVYTEARELSQATGTKHVVDHIIPLALGGTHHPDNLQVLTEAQNSQKGIKVTHTKKERIDQAIRSIVDQYGRVLHALATGNTAGLGSRPSKPTLWD